MGRSLPSFLDYPVDHDARLEVSPDELEKPLILDARGESSHEDVVVDPVEEFLQIAVDDPRIALGDVPLGLLHRLTSALPRSKSVTVRRERRIKDRREHL